MNKAIPRETLTIQSHFADLRNRYNETRSKYINILALGGYGSGKTQLFSTCPKPIKIDSFDPGGTNTAALQPLIDKGDLIVSRFEDDDWTPDPERRKPGQPYSSVLGNVEPTPEAIALAREVWESIGYRGE